MKQTITEPHLLAAINHIISCQVFKSVSVGVFIELLSWQLYH